MSFTTLKKNRKQNFEKLRENLNKTNNSGKDDNRFWNLTKDKSGVGDATIRFIPDKNSTYWALAMRHSFQNASGKWYIEDCPSAAGQPCPVCETNSELWNSGVESNKDVARQRSRKKRYIVNIYVVKDRSNPDNEGQVKLFECGPKIFEKIKTKMQPEFEDDTPQDPFDLWDGMDFKLRSKMKGDYLNYDDSGFTTTNCFEGFTDEQLEKIFNSTHDLSEFEPKAEKMKPYADLKKRFDAVVGNVASKKTAVEDDEAPVATPKKAEKTKAEPKQTSIDTSDDTDDLLAEIESLISD